MGTQVTMSQAVPWALPNTIVSPRHQTVNGNMHTSSQLMQAMHDDDAVSHPWVTDAKAFLPLTLRPLRPVLHEHAQCVSLTE